MDLTAERRLDPEKSIDWKRFRMNQRTARKMKENQASQSVNADARSFVFCGHIAQHESSGPEHSEHWTEHLLRFQAMLKMLRSRADAILTVPPPVGTLYSAVLEREL